MRMMRMQTLRMMMLVKAKRRGEIPVNYNVSFWRLNEVSGWNSRI